MMFSIHNLFKHYDYSNEISLKLGTIWLKHLDKYILKVLPQRIQPEPDLGMGHMGPGQQDFRGGRFKEI